MLKTQHFNYISYCFLYSNIQIYYKIFQQTQLQHPFTNISKVNIKCISPTHISYTMKLISITGLMESQILKLWLTSYTGNIIVCYESVLLNWYILDIFRLFGSRNTVFCKLTLLPSSGKSMKNNLLGSLDGSNVSSKGLWNIMTETRETRKGRTIIGSVRLENFLTLPKERDGLQSNKPNKFHFCNW
jgi:hypothetical protein